MLMLILDVVFLVVLCWMWYKIGYNRAWEKLCREYIVLHKTTKFRPIRVIVGGTIVDEEAKKNLKVKLAKKEKEYARKKSNKSKNSRKKTSK